MSDSIPQDLKYTKEHEWARVGTKTVVVGVTAHAQEALGDVVYVELPKLGTQLVEGKQFGVIESTKAVSDLYAPISGTVVAVNDALTGNPSIINTDPYGQGWIVELEPLDGEQVGKLLDAAAYGALLK
ncbi:glycine cleavage system protein GcvH [Corallococcus sp. ZKHCc1 1396]|uniref:Glycine cleavage system H protein n=1 Tax=Corallococcus soli TaxID=2710757 RepID=A0ABR9PVU8_9BACT|nr:MULTISPECIES: glycine cleavage system protein GcvH [Corallococcus]MBE4752056.1 glycine cleavage system protein GcvH [Corallococcus soli]MCY1035479.1 glycine cleavage system protein GcvH [Corallococcus sp. BB11-1]RYZ33630.1 MAG: glycine cleavage system protein GcvH [Myxococcaceae bacterium]